MMYNGYNNQCVAAANRNRPCKNRISAVGVVLGVLSVIAAFAIGLLVGSLFPDALVAAQAALITFIVVILILIAIILIYRFFVRRNCDE